MLMTNSGWNVFSKKLFYTTNFKNPLIFKHVLTMMCQRWKFHARASVNGEDSVRIHHEGVRIRDSIDYKYLETIEKEFPLDDKYVKEFRTTMTMNLNANNIDDVELSKLRSKVLWDCCSRHIVKKMPFIIGKDFLFPKTPLSEIPDAIKLFQKRNQVTIE